MASRRPPPPAHATVISVDDSDDDECVVISGGRAPPPPPQQHPVGPPAPAPVPAATSPSSTITITITARSTEHAPARSGSPPPLCPPRSTAPSPPIGPSLTPHPVSTPSSSSSSSPTSFATCTTATTTTTTMSSSASSTPNSGSDITTTNTNNSKTSACTSSCTNASSNPTASATANSGPGTSHDPTQPTAVSNGHTDSISSRTTGCGSGDGGGGGSNGGTSGYLINGHRVMFPYKPYPAQMALVSNALSAIKNSTHAALESPTGTGKTLALLCASLAAQKSHNEAVRTAAEKERQLRLSKILAERAQQRGVGDCGTNNADFGVSDDDDFEPNLTSVVENETWDRRNIKIIFSTRTHGQVAQIVRELRKTPYKPRMCVLGSRKMYCINSAIRTKPNKNAECKRLNARGGCQYKARSKFISQSHIFQPGGAKAIWDVEDLVKFGMASVACPYYAAKEMAELAELVVCPYNYVLDPGIRGSLGLSLKNTVVIIDEAHNIEDRLTEVSSCEMPASLLQEARDQLEKLSRAGTTTQREDAQKVLPVVELFQKLASQSAVSCTHENPNVVLPGSALLSLLSDGKVDEAYVTDTSMAFGRLSMDVDDVEDEESIQITLSFAVLTLVEELLKVLTFFFSENGAFTNDYKLVYQQEGSRSQLQPQEQQDSISMWCLLAGVAFTPVAKNSRCVILASGTLAPIPPMCAELGQLFPIQTELPHFVVPQQVFICSLCRSMGLDLELTFNNVQRTEILDALGKAVISLTGAVPAGVLCFFPSYSLMNRVLQRWETTGTLDQIASLKTGGIFVENNEGEEFADSLRAYCQAVTVGSGSIFFGVCRGKLSEGLDFADDTARAVIVIGIPYPSIKDLRVNLKREYNDTKQICPSKSRHCPTTAIATQRLPSEPKTHFASQAQTQIQKQLSPPSSSSPSPPMSQSIPGTNSGASTQKQSCTSPSVVPPPNSQLTQQAAPLVAKTQTQSSASNPPTSNLPNGSAWYLQQALRAVNQAVGRIIRHKNDYGAVILIDARFREPRTAGLLSKWLRSNMKIELSADSVAQQLSPFFQAAHIAYPHQQVMLPSNNSIGINNSTTLPPPPLVSTQNQAHTPCASLLSNSRNRRGPVHKRPRRYLTLSKTHE
ncbi:Fanconi anemia group J protein [Pelomyxa schiedti]|nr:Fanconi anemia group J protein [Pelomyxa schiedti]